MGLWWIFSKGLTSSDSILKESLWFLCGEQTKIEQKCTHIDSEFRWYCFSPGERFTVTLQSWEVAVGQQGSVIHWVWGVDSEGEGGHFPRGSGWLQTQGVGMTVSTSLKCLPGVAPLRALTFPSHSLWASSLIVGTVCVLRLSQHSHDSSVSQLVRAWACEPFSQWNLCQSFWVKRFACYATDLESESPGGFYANNRGQATGEWSQYRANKTKLSGPVYLYEATL